MKPCVLPGLPLELLLQICGLLPPVDLVCLCLCNHQLHALFRGYFRLPPLRADKFSILTRMERDLPEYFACDICNILHWYDGSESFGLSGLSKNKTCRLPCDRKGYDWRAEQYQGSSISMRTHSVYSHSRNRISFLQVKLAIRRFCYGLNSGISTESLSFTQVRRHSHPWEDPECGVLIYPNIITLFSIEARICPQPLGVYIRMQDIILFRIWEDSKIDSTSNPFRYFEICRHTSLKSRASDLDTVYDGKEEFFCYTCPKCNTVSLIEICMLDSSCKIALIMTRWANVGPGFDREDPLWKIHTYHTSSRSFPKRLHNSLMTYSPRKCFEDMGNLSFEELRSRNMSYLRGDQYEKGGPFVQGGSFIWHISYKEPLKNFEWENICTIDDFYSILYTTLSMGFVLAILLAFIKDVFIDF